MIYLNIQIKLIIFSLIFGFLFSIILDTFYKIIINKNKIYSCLLSFFIVLIMTIIYFIGIKQIGYIIFHLYSVLAIILGFICYEFVKRIIEKR